MTNAASSLLYHDVNNSSSSSTLPLELLSTLKDVGVSLAKLVYLTTFAVAKLVILSGPYVLTVARAVIDFHRTQLTLLDIAIELVFLSLLTCFVVFHKRITKALRRFEKSIHDKSKIAIKAAPHICFFALALVFAVIGRKFLAPLTREKALPVFTVVLPACTTFYSLLASVNPTVRVIEHSLHGASAPELREAAVEGRHKVLLWIVLAFYHAVATCLSIAPFSRNFLQYLPVVRELILVVVIWAQLSPVFVEIIFEVASPILHYAVKRVPASSIFGPSESVTSMTASTFLLSSLSSMHILTTSRLSLVRSIMQESSSFFLIALFIATPTPIATLGVALVALLVPAIRSAAAIQAWDKNETEVEVQMGGGSAGTGDREPVVLSIGVFSSGRKVKKHSLAAIDIIHQQKRWMEYWVILALVWSLRPYQLALWPSLMMLLCWYLQHSFLCGAKNATAYLVSCLDALAKRPNPSVSLLTDTAESAGASSAVAATMTPGQGAKGSSLNSTVVSEAEGGISGALGLLAQDATGGSLSPSPAGAGTSTLSAAQSQEKEKDMNRENSSPNILLNTINNTNPTMPTLPLVRGGGLGGESGEKRRTRNRGASGSK